MFFPVILSFAHMFLLAAPQVQPLSSNTNTVPSLDPENPEKQAIISRFNYFDLEILQAFSESNGNLFVSPANIKTVLALILEGARGKCAEELRNALRIDNIDRVEIREFLRRLLFDLSDKSPNTLLETTSSVFVSDRFKILPAYERKLTDYYNATARNVDFTNSPEAARYINSWVFNSTHGLIKEIVGQGNIYADTTILISNALFFKGKWKTAFDVKRTSVKCFRSPTRGCVNTPMMQVTDTFNYNVIPELNAHAIELPYQDEHYAMLILIPGGGNSVRVVARDMQHAKFTNILDQLRPVDIVFELPRFEIEFTTDLIPYLRQLKIQEVFGPNANLTGIIPQQNIKISSILHKTKIEVTEQGTRAAASTAAIVIPLMGNSAQKLVADHPFVFFIYHKESRNIIFEGILMEPAAVVLPTPVKTDRVYSVQQRIAANYPTYPSQQQQREQAQQRQYNARYYH